MIALDLKMGDRDFSPQLEDDRDRTIRPTLVRNFKDG